MSFLNVPDVTAAVVSQLLGNPLFATMLGQSVQLAVERAGEPGGVGVEVGTGGVGGGSSASAAVSECAESGWVVGAEVVENGEGSVTAESEESGGSVEIVGGIPVSDAVKRVKFGGVADCHPGVGPVVEPEVRFMATYVRTQSVREFKCYLERLSGCRFPKAHLQDLALCRYALATVPGAFAGGKRRLRQFMAVGDAALTLHVVTRAVRRGLDVESAQSARAKFTSNARLQQACVTSGLAKFLVAPGGVELGETKTGADAVEAVVGLLAMYRGADACVQYMTALGLLQ